MKHSYQTCIKTASFSAGKRQKSKGADAGAIEIPEHLRLKSDDISSLENFENFLTKNKEEISREAEETVKNVHTLMKTYNFQPKKQPEKRSTDKMTVKEHIENSFWAFEQIVSMKDEIDKMVNSKLGATQNERHGPEKGINSLKCQVD